MFRRRSTKKRSFKRPSYKKKAFKRKRTRTVSFSKKRASYKRKKRMGPGYKVQIPRFKVALFPKSADRMRAALKYSARGTYQINGGATAPSDMYGWYLDVTKLSSPGNLPAGSITLSPWRVIPPISGVAHACQMRYAQVQGLYTMGNKFNNYYVDSVDFTMRVTRQDANSPDRWHVGVCPLNQFQCNGLIEFGTASDNNSVFPPENKSLGTYSSSDCILAFKAQNMSKSKLISNVTTGPARTVIKQSWKVAKFYPIGYPISNPATSQGAFPSVSYPYGVVPTNFAAQYITFFSEQGGIPYTGATTFDIEWDLVLNVVGFNPIFNYNNLQKTLGDEGKEEKQHEDDDMHFEDLTVRSPLPPPPSPSPKPTPVPLIPLRGLSAPRLVR
jgi:hypothetical protein